MPIRDLVALPKVDLHVHLEGSIRAGTLAELAEANGAVLPSGLRDGRYTFRDFPHFIEQFVASLACLASPQDLYRVAREFCEDEVAQGVRHAEPFLSLADHAAAIPDLRATLEAVLAGLRDGGEATGLGWALIVDVVRGIDMGLSRSAMRHAVAFAGRGVIGIGLGGNESFPPEAYRGIFAEARAGGLHTVAHAGESAGPQSVRGAIRALGAERIGHGIRVLEDLEVTAEVRDLGIPLEVCLTSNVRTGVVASLEAHPLPALVDAGLVVTLNSDDPAMFASPLAGEYGAARGAFGFDDRRLADLARNGVRASFADDATKAALEREIDAWLA